MCWIQIITCKLSRKRRLESEHPLGCTIDLRDHIGERLSDAVHGVQLEVGEVDLNGLAQDSVPSFNKCDALCSGWWSTRPSFRMPIHDLRRCEVLAELRSVGSTPAPRHG